MNAALAWPKIRLGIIYFIAASLALLLARHDGGVAFLWVACAVLLADLLRQPRSRWLHSIVPCAVASMVATTLFGLGWKVAPFFALLNMIEAVVAAWLFRRSGQRDRMLGSPASLGHFVLAAGIVAPIVAAAIAGAILWGMGRPVLDGMIDVATGHALGTVTFTPLALKVARGQLWRHLDAATARQVCETGALLLILAAVSTFVFTRQATPLLFVPILPIIIIAFRAGAGATVVALGMLTAIGGGATASGMGPAQVWSPVLGEQLQYVQLYLAVTVLTALPVVADLKNRARLHRLVQSSEARFRLLADHSTDVLVHLELDGRIRYISPSIQPLSGHSPGALLGRNGTALVAPEHLDRVVAAHRAVVTSGGATQSCEYLGLCADGSTRWFENQSRAICDEQGRVESVLSVARDIAERKTRELRLVSEALTDPLTGLPNRRAFRAAIDRRISEKSGERNLCLAVFDIDRFKSVNDEHGHDAGDAVLRTFAKVLRRVIRETDSIARIGGEEFAVIFPATSVPDALAICDRLRREMASEVTFVGGQEVRVTVSGGVASLGSGGPDAALKQADRALYTAKRGGRDQMALAA